MAWTVDPQRLRRHLEFIIGERSPAAGARHLAEVEAFVAREFQSCGVAVESDYFLYRGQKFRNIVGRLGTGQTGPLVVLGAHLDAVRGTPGADDNASGVAVMVEAARLLARARVKRQVLFCAFNLEESNMLGSGSLAARLKAGGTKVAGMFSLEMVGYTDPRPGRQQYPTGLKWLYPDRADFLALVGNWNSSALLRTTARAMRQVPGLPVETLFVPGNGGLLPAVRLSDHAPFWDAGYPALMVTDTAFFRNPHYHRASDTLDTLDVGFMARVCEGVVRSIAAI